MPVSARLLQRLHETLGDEATNDLFAWWEEAATVNRVAVREIADLYFERFDTHLERRLAELRAEVDKKLAELRADFDKNLAELRADFDRNLADQRVSLIKWMFAFWIGTIVPLAGLMIALVRLLQ